MQRHTVRVFWFRAMYQVELKGMADRIISMRHKLHDSLVAAGAPSSWRHIVSQIGMFSFTSLTAAQVRTRNLS